MNLHRNERPVYIHNHDALVANISTSTMILYTLVKHQIN